MLREYELVLVLSPQLAEEQVSGVVERVSQFVKDRGGSVTGVNPWGRRRLAYPIRKALEGHYILAQLQLEPESVKELEANLHIAEDVLRHLLVRTDE